jgi:UrcA family protein
MTRFTIAMILGALALTTTCAPASAQVSERVVVKYNDLDLRSAEGVRTFHRRLQQAITQVCGDYDAGDPVRSGNINACRDDMQLTVAHMERQKIDAARTATQVAFAQAKAVH